MADDEVTITVTVRKANLAVLEDPKGAACHKIRLRKQKDGTYLLVGDWLSPSGLPAPYKLDHGHA